MTTTGRVLQYNVHIHHTVYISTPNPWAMALSTCQIKVIFIFQCLLCLVFLSTNIFSVIVRS